MSLQLRTNAIKLCKTLENEAFMILPEGKVSTLNKLDFSEFIKRYEDFVKNKIENNINYDDFSQPNTKDEIEVLRTIDFLKLSLLRDDFIEVSIW